MNDGFFAQFAESPIFGMFPDGLKPILVDKPAGYDLLDQIINEIFPAVCQNYPYRKVYWDPESGKIVTEVIKSEDIMATPEQIATRKLLDHAATLPWPAEGGREATPIGDLNSNAVGTGARKNAGKPQVHQIPLWVLSPILKFVELLKRQPMRFRVAVLDALDDIGHWQRGSDKSHLESAATMLIMGGATIEGVAGVLEYGERKYKKGNWAKGMAWSICLDCAVRHILKALDGKEYDVGPNGEGEREWHEKYSGKRHVDLALCNVLFLLAYYDLYPEGDDRIPEFNRKRACPISTTPAPTGTSPAPSSPPER